MSTVTLDDNVAVLVIDMQTNFVDGMRRRERRSLIAAQTEILDYCTENDVPVALIEFGSKYLTVKDVRNKVYGVPRYETFVKDSTGAFTNSTLAGRLYEWQAHSLILTGLYANGCVKATARGALNWGFDIVTAPQLIVDPIGRDIGYDSYLKYWYGKNGVLLENFRELFPNNTS